MSLFVPMTVKCPSCDHPITMEAVGSVNADRRPDYRDDILENTFQDIACEKCGETFRMEPEFIYLDAGVQIAELNLVDILNHQNVDPNFVLEKYNPITLLNFFLSATLN